jgi:hypothetical protein
MTIKLQLNELQFEVLTDLLVDALHSYEKCDGDDALYYAKNIDDIFEQIKAQAPDHFADS